MEKLMSLLKMMIRDKAKWNKVIHQNLNDIMMYQMTPEGLECSWCHFAITHVICHIALSGHYLKG